MFAIGRLSALAGSVSGRKAAHHSVDPYEMAHLMIAHIDKKRKALGIDKARERVLMDMADRQKLEAA